MFRFASRRSPFRLVGLLLVAILAINLFGALAGGALAAGVSLLVFPFFLFKMFMLFMFFRFMFGFVRPGPWSRRSKGEDQPSEEEAEFREHVRKAREQLDELFPQD